MRYSVPQASFLLHGVSSGFKNESLDEKDLDERLDGMKVDSENIARIIAANSLLDVEEVEKAMFERTTLDAEQAKEWGIIHDIKADLFAEDEEVVSIQYPLNPEPQQ